MNSVKNIPVAKILEDPLSCDPNTKRSNKARDLRDLQNRFTEKLERKNLENMIYDEWYEKYIKYSFHKINHMSAILDIQFDKNTVRINLGEVITCPFKVVYKQNRKIAAIFLENYFTQSGFIVKSGDFLYYGYGVWRFNISW
jgi:hypothetical protein